MLYHLPRQELFSLVQLSCFLVFSIWWDFPFDPDVNPYLVLLIRRNKLHILFIWNNYILSSLKLVWFYDFMFSSVGMIKVISSFLQLLALWALITLGYILGHFEASISSYPPEEGVNRKTKEYVVEWVGLGLHKPHENLMDNLCPPQQLETFIIVLSFTFIRYFVLLSKSTWHFLWCCTCVQVQHSDIGCAQ